MSELREFTPEQNAIADDSHEVFADMLYARMRRRDVQGEWEAELTGGIAAVADIAWRSRAKDVDVETIMLWWNEIGLFYFRQFHATDTMGEPVGSMQ